jgi:ABC-type bacteriocin/lantibiotic exporter with double-glycine peptidase domain
MGWIMTVTISAGCALWFPHHFLGDSQYLGREGVFFQQSHSDCGGAALKMVFDRCDIPMEYARLLNRLRIGPQGTTMLNLKQLAESEGLLCEGWRLAPHDLRSIPLPAVLLLRRSHFVVVERIDGEDGIFLLDPVRGRLRVSMRKLVSIWQGETLVFGRNGTAAKEYRRWFVGSEAPARR